MWFGLAVVLLPVVWGVMQQVGPRGPVPAADPLLLHNQRAAALANNAADAYEKAATLLGTSWPRELDEEAGVDDTPLPERATAWLGEHRDVLDALYEATAEECLLNVGTMMGVVAVPVPAHDEFRTFARVLALEARAAAAEHDIARFHRAEAALYRLGAHLGQQDLLITTLVGQAIRSMWANQALLPFEWSDTPEAERAAYADALLEHDPKPIDLTRMVLSERDLMIWTTRGTLAGMPSLLVSGSRLAGEIDRLNAPVLTFAALTPEEQLRVLRAGRGIPGAPQGRVGGFAQFFNVPRTVATTMAVDYARPAMISQWALTHERGILAAAAVWKHRLTHGAFPASLAQAGADAFVDPFANAPFTYRLAGDGFMLYSVAMDGDDDGGTHEARFGESIHAHISPDGDFVIWPVQRPEPRDEESAGVAGDSDPRVDEDLPAEAGEDRDEVPAPAP